MKACTLAYIPPPSLPYAEPFLRNVRKHKASFDLLLYSDHPWQDVQRLRGQPEEVKNEKTFTLSNLVFFTGMGLAERAGYSHVLYVEADSRVSGDGWDERIFEEFIDQPVPAIIGGSVAVHNPCNAGRVAALRWEELVSRNSRRNYPVATHMHVPVLAFGNKGSAEKASSCVFCYGSGTVIDIAWYKALFTDTERDPACQTAPTSHQFGIEHRIRNQSAEPSYDSFWAVQIARASRPWDIELGVRIWERFGADSYSVIANLPSIFSSYGDQITTEAERLAMLRDGSRALCHQIKSSAEV